MSKPSPILGRALGQAICAHFGIDTTKHTVDSDFEIKTEPGTPVTVKLTLMLTADDLAGIARMAGADRFQVEDAKRGVEEKESKASSNPYNGSLPRTPFGPAKTMLLSDALPLGSGRGDCGAEDNHTAAAESARAQAEILRDSIQAACDLPAMDATSQRTNEPGELRLSIDPDTSELLRRYGLGSGGAIHEIRLLREEVKQMRENIELTQYAIAKNAKRVARHLERWDSSGLPEHSNCQSASQVADQTAQRG